MKFGVNDKNRKPHLIMKKIIFLLLALSYLTVSNTTAQVCPQTDFPSYYYCSEILEFVAEYPECSKLPSSLRLPYDGGDLTNYPALLELDSIDGNIICNECEITSFAGLANLTYVSGGVHIDEPHSDLVNLQGLNNLYYIGGILSLSECSDLISTIGLGDLTYLGGLSITESNVLVDLIGFENIESLIHGLAIDEAISLEDLQGFESLNYIGGNLVIRDNDSMSSLEGLNSLKTIVGDLKIDDNPILLELNALSNLNSLNGSIYCQGNNALQSLEGLAAITGLNGLIKIRYNESLESLSGLENIDANSILDLTLSNCVSLNYCSLDNFCQYLTENIGPSSINTNNIGCNSEIEVTNICQDISVNLIETVFPEPKLIRMINVFGQDQQLHRNGMLLFYVYDNGEVEKRMIH